MIEKFISLERMYFWLGYFTSFYLILSAVEFFANLHLVYPAVEHALDALSEPYLGGLAVYVILKEIRKKRRDLPSLHRGERFVAAWLTLFAATSLAVVLSEFYRFDVAYRLIVSNSLASFMVYLGSRLHRP